MTEVVPEDASKGVAESLEKLEIGPGSDLKANGNGTANHGSDTEPAASPQESQAPSTSTTNGGVDNLVDHALRDALSHVRHRHAVLRLEDLVEKFVLNSTEPQYLFPAETSTYERLLTHRTAQHWGLETSTINQGPEQGCIIAIRTPKSGPPQMKLADFPVKIDETQIAAQGPAPRLLVRKPRNNERGRHNGAIGGGPGGGGGGFSRPGPQTIEDRELHYEQARRRIFGDATAMYGHQQQPPAMMAYPYAVPMSPGAAGGGAGAGMAQRGGGMPPVGMSGNGVGGGGGGGGGYPQQRGMPPQGRGMMHNGGGGYDTRGNGGGGGGGGRGKAQLRNRQEDLSDPDFRRNRHHGGPRFDPGFGDEAQHHHHAGIYIHPTYTSEFPELVGGPGGAMGHLTSPRANGGVAGVVGGPGAGGAGGPGGAGNMGYPGGSYPAAMMTPYGYAQGMLPQTMMAAQMPGAGPGGMPVYAGAAGGVSYPAGAYLAQMGPYGYVPVRPDGMVPASMMQMQMAYGGYPANAMGGGGPMSPTAMGGGGHGGGGGFGGASPGGNMRRGGGGGGRRGGGGGGSRGSNSSSTNTPRAAPLTPPQQAQQQVSQAAAAAAIQDPSPSPAES